MSTLLDALLAALFSGSFLSATLGFLFYRRTKAIEARVSEEMQQGLAVFQSRRSWREQSLAGLLGPMFMQLDRTERAFARWKTKNLYIESKIIREGNLAIRDLLLQKGHLIPPHLLPDASALVEHYDRWLEEFERRRVEQNPEGDADFVFVGPQGYPFPRMSAKRFEAAYREAWEELYASADKAPGSGSP